MFFRFGNIVNGLTEMEKNFSASSENHKSLQAGFLKLFVCNSSFMRSDIAKLLIHATKDSMILSYKLRTIMLLPSSDFLGDHLFSILNTIIIACMTHIPSSIRDSFFYHTPFSMYSLLYTLYLQVGLHFWETYK